MREYKKSKKETKTSETVKQKEARLAKERQRKRASRKRTSRQKQAAKKDNCTSHPIEEGTSNPVSNYSPSENINELAPVRKFHNSVSAGPLYICTCCDQLWYKHSVLPAD